MSTGTWLSPELSRFRAACLARNIQDVNTGWEDVLLPLGMLLAGDAFGDSEMAEWVRRWTGYHLAVPVRSGPPQDAAVQKSGARHQGIFLSQYCGEWGALSVLAELSRIADDKLTLVSRQIADYICDNALRLPNGTLAHASFFNAPWVDTLYFASGPLARAFAVTREHRYADEAVRQCLLHAEYLRDESSGCFFHDADPDSGLRSNWLWSRGNGWVIMAFGDVLRWCPPSMPGWHQVLRYYRSLATGLLRLQHPSGLWRIIPENDESHLETSGSAMIATGLAIGIAEGWLERSAGYHARRVWQELATWIDDSGRLLGSQTPAGRGGWETHKRSRIGETTYGTGSMLRLAAELKHAALI